MEIEQENSDQQQSSQIFDASTDKWVDNPSMKVSKDEPEDPALEEEEAAAKPAKKEEKAKETEEEEPSETEEEPKETEEEEPEPEAAKKEEEPDDSIDPDQYITQTYGEKYGLKTEAELTNVIENAMDLMDELETVKAERDTLKAESGKPKFTSDKQQKAYEFLSQFDIDRQGEALDSFAKILTMDMDKANPKMILEEAFVHRNVNKWTREEAQKMFAREYSRQYSIKRETFDGSDAEFEEEQSLKDLQMKGDVEDAKSYLKEQKAKYKPAEKQEAKTPEVITNAIKKNASEFQGFLSKTEQLSLGTTGEKYIFKLDAEQREQLSDAFDKWVKNPSNYNEKGEIVGIANPQEMLDRVTGALFLNDIVDSLKSQIKNQVETKRVDEVAKNSPKKRAAPAGGDVKTNSDDLDEQARRLIKAKKAA